MRKWLGFGDENDEDTIGLKSRLKGAGIFFNIDI